MLTKQEITKKKSFDSDDVTPDAGDLDEQKLRKKRFFIVLSIALTIGLSLVFIIYRQLKEIIANPQLTIPALPQLSLSKPVVTSDGIEDLTAAISQIITVDQSKWNITVANKTAVYNWPNNRVHYDQSQVETLSGKISQRSPSTLLSELLPLGLEVKEESSSSDDQQKITAIVYTPDRQLFFDIQYQGTATEFQKITGSLIPTIYWSAISSVATP